MKFKPPVSEKIYDFKFPSFTKRTLSPNLEIYHCKRDDTPLFNIKIISKSGSYDEEIPGLTYLSAQMTTKGTKKRSQEKLADEMDFLGLNLNAGASWDMSYWNLSCMEENKENALDLLGDCINNSNFPKREIDISKGRIVADISQKKAEPSYLAKQAFYSGIYQNNPYRNPLTGDEKSVSAISRNNLINRFNELFYEKNITIISSSQNNLEDTLNLLNRYFKFDNGTEGKQRNRIRNIIPKHNSIRIASKESAEQTVLRIGKLTIGINHPDYIPLSLANTIFGGYFMSRLNGLIREKLGYTYGIHSFIDYRLNGSTLQVTSSVNKSTTAKTVSEVFKLMEKFTREPVKVKEFQRAKQYSLGTFLRNTESNQQIMSLIGVINLFNLKKNYYEDAYLKISNLTPEELFEVQQKYFSPENMVIAAAGDMKYLEKELKGFGEISYYEL
ncbi:MAG: insulinase family protein [Bacteroidetes bacterium]|nr:MAG: insulinase family protein [Bacteroidota bacterium]